MSGPERLTSTLLARKGEAVPAGGPRATIALPARPRPGAEPIQLQPSAAARAAVHAAATRQAEFLGRGPGETRVAFTVRLDPDRHLRLKILAARRRQTGQQIMLSALDAWLEACGAECTCTCAPGRPDERN